MKKTFLIIFAALLMLTVFIASVSAQDVDNMSNEELATLLLQIMQKLDESGKVTETPAPTPTPVPTPTSTPQPELPSDDAELEALLAAIMQKLQQGEDPEAEKPETPAGTMVPVSDIEEEPENSIWENKKLIIEGLPSYMFIQPTREPKQDSNGGQTEHYPGEICDYDSLACDMVDGIPVNCHPYRTWELVDGVWMCPAG